ncbi:MAG: hypothetical protein U0793_23115 [Gemmataceae bacterium]
MKRMVLAVAATLMGLDASVIQAQTPAGYPWLVYAISNETGRPIDPIGANTEEEAREKVMYLESFRDPGFRNVFYQRNPHVGEVPRATPPSRPSPPPPPSPPRELPAVSPPRPLALANTSWAGGETLRGYGRLTFRFGPGKTVDMIDTDGTTPGTYSRSGASVTLQFYDGTVVYSGTLQDNIIHGSGRHGPDSWTFSVRLR